MTDDTLNEDDSNGEETDHPTDAAPGPGQIGPSEAEPEPADDEVDGEDTGDDEDSGRRPLAGVFSGAYRLGGQLGYGLGLIPYGIGLLIWKTVEGVVYGFTRVLPKGSSLWESCVKIGLKNLRRSAGADRINFVMKQGHLLIKPLYWNNKKVRWETKGGHEWWNGGSQHLYTGPGGVPCSWAAARATELGDQVQAEVAEALELGAKRDLYLSADVSIHQLTLDAGDATANGGQAVADGGVAEPLAQTHVTVDRPGLLADQVTDLNTLYVDERFDEPAAGRLVSMEKYYETYPETVDSEEMQKQEDRGLLAQMNKGSTWKIALYCMIAAFVFILAWEFLPGLLGGATGGGGGGSFLPWFLVPGVLG